MEEAECRLTAATAVP